MGMDLVRCPTCRRAGIARKRVSRTYQVAGGKRTVRRVEAQVCPHCGGVFLDLAAAEQIDRALDRSRRRRTA